MPHSRRIAELLINIGAIKLSVDPPFTLVSGIKSPIYCDVRMLYGHPEARNFIVKALVERVRALHVQPDVIAGTATAAIGWAALVADRMDLPFVFVRSKAKDHGTKQLIEGDLKQGRDIVLIEDMFSTAGSAMASVEALRSEGECTVRDVLAVYTHEFHSSVENAQKHDVTLHPLCTLGEVLNVAVEFGELEKDVTSSVLSFSKDPKHWHP